MQKNIQVLMIQHVCCSTPKSYMLTKPQALWYKFYSLNWDFFLPEIIPFSGRNPSLFRKAQSSLRIFFPPCIEDLQPKIYKWALYFFHSSMAIWPEDNLLCIFSSLEPLPWEQLKRLEPEKFPVCRPLIRFQCRGRDPQTISASSHLISLAYVKNIIMFS